MFCSLASRRGGAPLTRRCVGGGGGGGGAVVRLGAGGDDDRPSAAVPAAVAAEARRTANMPTVFDLELAEGRCIGVGMPLCTVTDGIAASGAGTEWCGVDDETWRMAVVEPHHIAAREAGGADAGAGASPLDLARSWELDAELHPDELECVASLASSILSRCIVVLAHALSPSPSAPAFLILQRSSLAHHFLSAFGVCPFPTLHLDRSRGARRRRAAGRPATWRCAHRAPLVSTAVGQW